MTKIVRLLLPYFHDKFIEAGIDEAGRGCYAGPVFAAAVILSKDFFHPLLNDSKKMTAQHRYELRSVIEEKALAWSVGSVSNEEIDCINILQASYRAMHIAISKTSIVPELLLIDGNRFKQYKSVPHKCIIKGDGTYASIAAASVLAKTYRDDYMNELHKEFEVYGWDKNKGYGTLLHRTAIAQYGLCKYHRKSFNIYSEELISR